jgi:hypothetical protein
MGTTPDGGNQRRPPRWPDESFIAVYPRGLGFWHSDREPEMANAVTAVSGPIGDVLDIAAGRARDREPTPMTGTAGDGPKRPELTVVQGGHDGAITSTGRTGLELPISIMLRGSAEVALFREAMNAAEIAGAEKTRLEQVFLALGVVARALADTIAEQGPPEVIIDIDQRDPGQGLISVFLHKPPFDRPRSA